MRSSSYAGTMVLLVVATLLSVVLWSSPSLAGAYPTRGTNAASESSSFSSLAFDGRRAPLPSSPLPATAATSPNPIMAKLRRFVTVTPQLTERSGHTAATLANLEPGEHPEKLSYTIEAYGRAFELNLKKSVDLFSPNYKEIRLAYQNGASADPVQHVSKDTPVHCYYDGHVTGDEDSYITVSTCSGLRGHVHAHGEEFSIEPAAYSAHPALSSSSPALQSTEFTSSAFRTGTPAFTPTSHPVQYASPRHYAFPLSRIPTTEHIVFRQSDVVEETKSCGVPEHSSMPFESMPIENDDDAASAARVDIPNMGSLPGGVGVVPGSNGAATEVIELLVFNDNARWRSKGEGTEADTLAILNSVKTFYKSTTFVRPTRMVLVGQVTFSEGDPYTAEMTSSGVGVEGNDGLLNVFHDYRKRAQSILPRHNNGQLFSERRFTSNIMGLAGVGAMCSQWSGSICCMTSSSMIQNAMISAHETGHTLSMLHDGSGGAGHCPNGGFIMATTTGTATTFSRCSIAAANSFMRGASSQCMYNTASIDSPIESALHWHTNPWSSCTRECGGTQSRAVECVDSTGAVHPASACEGMSRPADSKLCDCGVSAEAGTAPESSHSQLAVIITAAVVGASLGVASSFLFGETIRRCRDGKLLPRNSESSSSGAPVALGQEGSESNKSAGGASGVASSSSKADDVEAATGADTVAAPQPITSTTGSSSSAVVTPAMASNGIVVAPAAGAMDATAAATGAAAADCHDCKVRPTACRTHKTPRSVPRTIRVTE